MPQIHPGKKIPYALVPVDEDGNVGKLERPATVSVEAPAVLESTSSDNLTGFVQNPGPKAVSVLFAADGDGKFDNQDAFTIHYEASIDLLGKDAVSFQTNVFGDEVDI